MVGGNHAKGKGPLPKLVAAAVEGAAKSEPTNPVPP
jgi:hypothetical protein